ncbi:MAG: PAS domain S-box protein [Acidobacteriota bacterium]
MHKILRGSVQKKILLLVFVSVLPSLAVIVNSGLGRLELSRTRADADALALADKAAEIQRGATEAVHILLSTLASLPDRVRNDPTLLEPVLSNALDRNPGLCTIAMTGEQGRITVAGESMPSPESQIARFAQGLAGPGGLRVGDYTVCGNTFQPALVFAYPPAASADASGMVVALARFDRFRDYSKALALPEGSTLTIADRHGRVLYSSAHPGSLAVGSKLDQASLELLSGEDDQGVERVQAGVGTGTIRAFTRLRIDGDGTPYALILASIPADKAMQAAREMLWRDVLLVLGAAVLALTTALVAGKIIIVGNVKRLIGAAGQMEAGRLDARSGLDYRDGELGRLAQSFDSMAEALANDISRRVHAEKEFKGSRDFLDKIINSIADPIFVKDREHRLILVNDAYCALIGKPRDQVTGRTDNDFFTRSQVDFFRQRDDLVLETGREDESEEVITDALRQLRIIVTKRTRYADDSGNTYVVGVLRDVTEAKRSGMELVNRTTQLDARVKMLNCLYGISHLAQKRGVTLDRLLAEAVALLPPMLTYAQSAVARIVFEGAQYPSNGFTNPATSMAADIMMRGRSMGFVETGYLVPMPIQGEGPFTHEERKILHVVAEHLSQIAERSLAEEELRHSEERFRRIVETANEGIAVLDPAQRVTYVNTVMAEMLGYEQGEIVGQHIENFLYEPARPEQGDCSRRRQSLGAKRERLFLRKDGTLLCTIASVTPVTDREGHFAGSFGMYADITDRKMAEEKLQELNESLEQLVRDRTEDLLRKTADLETKAGELQDANLELTQTAEKLEKARRLAEEATKAKSIFLANMSHEVRTPINAILGLSDLALRRGAAGEVRRFLDMILKSSRDLLALVNDILDFSKLEAGRTEVEAIGFDLPRLVREALVTFAHQAEAKGLRFDVVIDDDVPRFVLSDPIKIRAILSNLCSNAVKFTSAGWIRVMVVFEHRQTRFLVEDTGIGIPEDKRSFIFKSFRQVDETVGRKYGGTGLGLSISRRLAILLGGTLAYSAREGGGSRFALELPLQPSIEQEESHERRDSELRLAEKLAPMRILLAEDHEMGRELLGSFLTGLGHEVVCAEDGAQALEKLRESSFDLVLMDGRMPVMDGLEATRAIRSGACGRPNSSVPVVAITAQALAGDREAFLEAGMDDYVTKPVDLDEILLVLARHAPLHKRPELSGTAWDVGTAGAGASAVESGPGNASTPSQPGEIGQDAREAPQASGETQADPAAVAPLLDREGALARLKGMAVLLEAMEATFLKATPGDMSELESARKNGDAAGVRLYSHRIKGNSAGVGALRLSEAAGAMELNASKGVLPGTDEVRRLEELLALTSAELVLAGNTGGTRRQEQVQARAPATRHPQGDTR